MDRQPALHNLVRPQVDHSYNRILRSTVMRFDTLAGNNPTHEHKHHRDNDSHHKSTKSKNRSSKKNSSRHRQTKDRDHHATRDKGVPILGASTSDKYDNNRNAYLVPPSSRAPPGPASYYAPDTTSPVLDQRRLRQYRFTPGKMIFKSSASSGDLPLEQPSEHKQETDNRPINQYQAPAPAPTRDERANIAQHSDRWSSQPQRMETKEEGDINEQQKQQQHSKSKTTTSKEISPESLVTKLSQVTEHWSQTLDDLGTAQRDATAFSNRCHDQERLLEEYQSRNQAMAQDLQRESERVFEMEGMLLGLQRQVAGLASERQTRLLQQSQKRNSSEEDADKAQKKALQELRLANEKLNGKVIELMLDKALLQQKQQKLMSDASETDGVSSNDSLPIAPDALLLQRVADLERLNGVLRRSIQLPERWRRGSADEMLRADNITNSYNDVMQEVARPSTAGI